MVRVRTFNQDSYLLAIESSCDETSAAVLHGADVLSNIVSSQLEHSKWGGVVPELASRAHVQVINQVVAAALAEAGLTIEDIDGLAVTARPGLLGSLVVGANFAKGLSLRYDLPLVAVDHVEGHVYSAFLEKEVIENAAIEFPYVALVVSGGHTSLFNVRGWGLYDVIGGTRDDAAGEAFDKSAKMLGLGYPGGIQIDTLAQNGNPDAIKFPRAMMHDDSLDFSFSGLKTSVRTYIQKNYPEGVPGEHMPDVCASLRAAIVDVLVEKTFRAAQRHSVNSIVVAGGVSANSLLRESMHTRAKEKGMRVVIPAPGYCTDNAAMIAVVGRQMLLAGQRSGLDFTVAANALRAVRPKGRRKKQGAQKIHR